MTSLIDRYIACWNEEDAEKRSAAIADVFGPDCSYTDPLDSISGQAELNALIGRVRDRVGDARFSLKGQVDAHHEQVLFFWRLELPSGQVLASGTDVATTSQGKIRDVYGFFDATPA